MAKIKYYYDTETCKYERVKVKSQDVIFNFLGLTSIIFILASILVFLYNIYFTSPEEVLLQNEVAEMEYYYEDLETEVERLNNILAALEKRDDDIYRIVLGAEPIDNSIRNAGIGGADRYSDIKNKDFAHGNMVAELKQKIDKLKRKMYIQSKSYDEIRAAAIRKEEMYASIPAIQPIANKELIRLASGFGWRIHPIYKVKKLHTGIDFSAPIGTPVYATADGEISFLEVEFSGYGKFLEIDHGFGYKSRYAHLHDFNVKQGQKVKRGELIAYVGNTGMSTAPHLHYEVLQNDQKINPIHYFFDDLNPEEYEKVVELASIENQSLGM